MSELPPQFLYRYYAGSARNIDSIKECYLWFSSLDKMNDPFEGVHLFDKRNLNLASAKSIIRRTLISTGMAPAIAERSIEQRLKKLKTQKQKLDYLIFSIQDTHESAYKEIINQGYCCMIGENATQEESLTDVQLILMWGHYGQGLAGFRVEFESIGLIDSLNARQLVSSNQVSYTLSPPGLDPTKVFAAIHLDEVIEHQTAREAILPCVTTKHVAWKYEQELRLSTAKPGKVQFDPKHIKEVVIGSKMEDPLKQLLIKVARDTAPHATIKLAKISNIEYKVELIDL